MNPGAPIALRLQSSLLYGVSKIYSGKCRYVLADMERFQAEVMAFERGLVNPNNQTDPEAGKSQ